MKKDTIEVVEKLMQKIICDSFPELKDKKIKVVKTNNLNYTAYIKKGVICDYVLKVSPRVKKYNPTLIRGILAHELSHPSLWQSRGYFKSLFVDLKRFTRKGLREDERLTDQLAIRRGYGEALKLQRLSRRKDNDIWYHKNKDVYMTPEEIAQYMKSMKKFP